jgi:hypothetical protein
MKQSIGIVLKSSHTNTQAIVILDQQRGKISGNVSGRTTLALGNGTVMTYDLICRRSWYTLEGVNLEYVPFESARDDIFFLHHVLELCYYFLPEECAVDEVFQMLLYLMHVAPYEKVVSRKYLVVARLLHLFGLYPEHDGLCAYLQKIGDMPLELFFDISCTENMQKIVYQWVWSCIMAHPDKKKFKTIELLKKAESHES